jgi:SAM-dependent methyltransferase
VPMVHEKSKYQFPSWSRYQRLKQFHRPGSFILRALQYEALSAVGALGNVLDVGGGRKCDYYNLLSCESYSSINIDAGIQPTWIVNADSEFPVESGSFDTVLAMNTFEHVCNPEFLLGEMQRSLRKNGRFVASTPFIYMIHAHPDDYFRPTRSWWQEKLAENGFVEIEITPLTWGPKSSGQCAVGVNGFGKRLKLRLAVYSDIIYSLLRSKNPKKLHDTLSLFPAGYFVSAIKS